MASPKEYSSLPLITSASGAIFLSAAAGWFLLDREAPEWVEHDSDAIPPLAAMKTADSTSADPGIDVEAELRKARLAADADFLVRPSERNALYFYTRVIEANPDHTAAIAEFEAVLSRISLSVSDHLAAGNYGDAHLIVELVDQQVGNRATVEAMRDALDNYANRLVELAIRHTEDGNDAEAAAVLVTAEALPGLGPGFISAARDSVAAIRLAREAAERERIEQERLAAEQTLLEWTTMVRDAISSGRLIAPTGESARDYLAERDAPADVVETLRDELSAALIDAVERSFETGDLIDSESYLDAASELSDDDEKLAELRDALERELIAAEGNRILGLRDFVRLNTVPARYPRLANQYNITGWVDVLFTVTPTGVTADIEVVEAEPENVFEESAIEAVEQWTFQPREYRGQLINQRTSARLVFRLE